MAMAFGADGNRYNPCAEISVQRLSDGFVGFLLHIVFTLSIRGIFNALSILTPRSLSSAVPNSGWGKLGSTLKSWFFSVPVMRKGLGELIKLKSFG